MQKQVKGFPKTLILSCIAASLFLAGCGGKDPEPGHPSSSAVPEETRLQADLQLIGEMEKLRYLDNSLDIYSRAGFASLDPEGELQEGESAFPNKRMVTGSGAVSFYAIPGPQFRQELVFADNQGNRKVLSYEEKDGLISGFMGDKTGSDNIITCQNEEEADGTTAYHFYEKDQNMEVRREIPIHFFSGKNYFFKDGMRVDAGGRIHLVASEMQEYNVLSETQCYYVFSADGELLARLECDDQTRIDQLATIYDGQVACVTSDWTGGSGRTIMLWDEQIGEFRKLAKLEWNVDYYRHPWYNALTMPDEDHVLYADEFGLFRLALADMESEALYRWSNHGISVSNVEVIAISGQGVSLIYESGESCNYLYLEPTEEDVEITTIGLAVSPSNLEWYRTIAKLFNRQYPACHIEIESDPEETALLTALIAGDGPVLIDSDLVGFEAQAKLWQPLGDILDQLGVTEELVPQVVECGKIDGELYGVPSNFVLRTVVTQDEKLTGWDYETFLEYVEARPDMKGIVNNYGEGAEIAFLSSFFIHGLEDNYFLDAEKKTTIFGQDEFFRLLDVADRYYPCEEAIQEGESLTKGEVMCNELSIARPEDVALYRILFGEGINFIGYPNESGPGHYINSGSPLCIRRNATDKEKQVALAFVKLLLSYECQLEASKDINFHLSVRRDVLEKQFFRMTEGTEILFSEGKAAKLGEDMDNMTDWNTFMGLLGQAQVSRHFPRGLNDIFWSEFPEYFKGTIDRKMLSDRLKNRVELYLNEN